MKLSNEQRKSFGLDPIEDWWKEVELKGDKYRPQSTLFLDGTTIRKQIISTEKAYEEYQYDVKTNGRHLLPATSKGKPKKLTTASLETKKPVGVYLKVNAPEILKIGNFTTQKTFYSSDWEDKNNKNSPEEMIEEFLNLTPQDHLENIEKFRCEKRRNIKYRSGDFFAFKMNLKEYGFGRVLADIGKLRKKKVFSEDHGWNNLFGKPLLIKLYSYTSEDKNVDPSFLKQLQSLPSDYIMDNALLYGDYEIIGNLPVEVDELDFPMSYGRRLDRKPNVFFQWGLIHKELSVEEFVKFLERKKIPGKFINTENPYGYYSIGFESKFKRQDIAESIERGGVFKFKERDAFDLRNPKNTDIRSEIMKKFGLDPDKSYEENRKLEGVGNLV